MYVSNMHAYSHISMHTQVNSYLCIYLFNYIYTIIHINSCILFIYVCVKAGFHKISGICLIEMTKDEHIAQNQSQPIIFPSEFYLFEDMIYFTFQRQQSLIILK